MALFDNGGDQGDVTHRPPVICLMGPTASGKTACAMAWADRWPVALISVDSAMVYRGMDIGTGKPTPEVLACYPHALVDIRDPAEPYSAGDCIRDVQQAIEQAYAAGKIPVLVGGTLLYFRAIQRGLGPDLPAQPAIRQELQKRAASVGWEALHAELAIHWPERAAVIHPRDSQRIQRAWELWWTHTHASPQTVGMAAPSDLDQVWQWPGGLPYQWRQMALIPTDRSQLHTRIHERITAMWAAGWWEEMEALCADPRWDPDLPAMRAVGYRQIGDHRRLVTPDGSGRGSVPLPTGSAYIQLQEKIAAATRQLAKRQLTWLRTWPDLHRCEMTDPAAIERTASVLFAPWCA